MAAPLVALNFWYLDFIFIVAFFAALLNNKEKFVTTSFAPMLLNISLIAALIISKDLPKEKIIWYLSYAVVIGGFAQALLHILVASKYKYVKMLCVGAVSKKKADLSRFKKDFFHSLLGNSVLQISAFIDTVLASFLAHGAISYLYYANRLFQLPYALFAISFSAVLFPSVNKALSRGDENLAMENMKRAFWYLLYLLILASMIIIIAHKEIVALLFERGAFGEKETQQTALVLLMYAIGLIPQGLYKLFSMYFNALHKQAMLAKFSVISLIINVAVSLALIVPMKVAGLALASSIGSIVVLFLALKEFGWKNLTKLMEKRYLFWMLGVIFGSIITAIVLKEVFFYLKIFIKGAI